MCGIAGADPVPPPGIRQVQHDTSLAGNGTTASPLGLPQTCSNGQVLAWSISTMTWGCAAGGGISGLTSGTVPVASSGTTLTNGSLADDGTSITIDGLKQTVCNVSSSTTIVNLTIPAGCTFAIWTPSVNADLVGISPPPSGSRHITIYVPSSGGGNYEVFPLNTNATATSWEIAGNITGGWLTVNSMFTVDYEPAIAKWITPFSQDVGTTNVHGTFSAAGTATFQADVILDLGVDNYIITQDTLSSGNTNINIDSSGTGPVRINSGTGSVTNAGTGGLLVYPGGSSVTPFASFTPSIITLSASGGTAIGTGDFEVDSSSSTAINMANGGTIEMADGSINDLTQLEFATGPVVLTQSSAFTGACTTGSIGINTTSSANPAHYFCINSVWAGIGSSTQHGALIKHQSIAAGITSYAPTSGTFSVHVRACGAGGGGGGVSSTTSDGAAAGGGGAGAMGDFWLISTTSAVTGGTTSVPSGAAGGSAGANPGAAGSSTTIVINSTTYTFGGGGGGAASTASASVQSVAGGTPGSITGLPTGAVISAQPGQGGAIINVTNTAGFSGAGGFSPMGTPGASNNYGTHTGNAASGFCAGGGGAVSNGSGTNAGGNGAPGTIQIDEYN